MSRKPVVLGVDIGGSHITAGFFDLECWTLIKDSIKRCNVNSSGSAHEILSSWCELIRDAFDDDLNREKWIGIAMPGLFDYEHGISFIEDQKKFQFLYMLHVKRELAERLDLSQSNIRFINDAVAFMQGEVFCGVAKGYRRALGITLGTRLGSAIAINGVSRDKELWKVKFSQGIAEDYLSTSWFVSKYKDLTGKEVKGVKELADIVAIDPYAKQIFNEFGRGFGHFLVDIIKDTDAEVVILGGNITQAFKLFVHPLQANLKAFHLNTVKATNLKEYAALIVLGTLCWRRYDLANGHHHAGINFGE